MPYWVKYIAIDILNSHHSIPLLKEVQMDIAWILQEIMV